MTAVAGGTWIRRPQATLWFARALAVLAGFALLMALVAFFAHPGPGTSPAVLPILGVMNLGLAAGTIWLARRYARRSIMISADGIVIRNLLSCRRISLEEADHFTAGVPASAGGPCPVLNLHNGRAVPVGGVVRVALIWRYEQNVRALAPVCDELNRLLAQVKRGVG